VPVERRQLKDRRRPHTDEDRSICANRSWTHQTGSPDPRDAAHLSRRRRSPRRTRARSVVSAGGSAEVGPPPNPMKPVTSRHRARARIRVDSSGRPFMFVPSALLVQFGETGLETWMTPLMAQELAGSRSPIAIPDSTRSSTSASCDLLVSMLTGHLLSRRTSRCAGATDRCRRRWRS
jgi:hypothetical protein